MKKKEAQGNESCNTWQQEAGGNTACEDRAGRGKTKNKKQCTVNMNSSLMMEVRRNTSTQEKGPNRNAVV